MPDRSTVLIVADDEADCRALVGVLSNQPTYEVVGPLVALDALRFCAKATPAVVLVHVELRDVAAAELCALIRTRANGTQFNLFYSVLRETTERRPHPHCRYPTDISLLRI